MCKVVDPCVSIVTPSLNQRGYIESTVRSVLTQDYANLEYLVMDSASTDGTVELLRRYVESHPTRMRFVSEQDRGQAHALNKAVAQTRGQIIGWLNSDDTYEPGAISAAVEYFLAHPEVDLIYGGANFVDSTDRVITRCAHVEPYDWNRLVHYTDFIVQPAAFFTRRAFEAVGGGDESLLYTMDYDLFLKIASKFKVAYLPQVLANFKWWGQNKSATGGWERLDEIERITAVFGAHGLPAYTRIEAAFLDLRCAYAAARSTHLSHAVNHVTAGIGRVLSSAKTIRSLSSPACWKVMWTGQILRHHLRSTLAQIGDRQLANTAR